MKYNNVIINNTPNQDLHNSAITGSPIVKPRYIKIRSIIINTSL